MPQRSLTVGTVQVTAVCDVTGDFPVPLDQAFPGVEAAAWAPWRRRHPDAFSGTDRWRLRDWCFVVRARDRVVLVDTGVGGDGVGGGPLVGFVAPGFAGDAEVGPGAREPGCFDRRRIALLAGRCL